MIDYMNETETGFLKNLKSLFFSKSPIFTFVLLLFLTTLAMTLTQKGLYFWILFGIISLLTIKCYNLVDTSAIFICLFGILYGLFSVVLSVTYSYSSLISCFIVPLPLYCFGRWLVYRLRGKNGELITMLFLSLLCISFILLYRTIVDVSQSGIVSVRRTFEIEGVETISATLYGMYAALTMVGLPLFFASVEKKTTLSWMFLALAACGILTTIHLVNRTGLVIAVIVTFIGVVYRSRAKIGKLFVLLGLIIAIVYILIKTNIIPSEVITAYELRNEESAKLGLSAAGGRGNRWMDAITRIFYMPFGWYGKEYITGYLYAHNWWLDVGRAVGIIPFLLLFFPTIISIKNCLILFREKNNDVCLLLITINSALFLATFVEPVMEGSVMIAYFYFFIWGVTSQTVVNLVYYKNSKSKFRKIKYNL